jgi:uncharacterized protein YkwD
VSKRITVIALLIAVATLFLITLPSVASATVTLNQYEKQVLALVNKERTDRHLAKLTVNTKLTSAARAHSTEMGQLQYFTHNSLSGETWRQRLIRFGFTSKGYHFWKAGEALFWGAGLYSSPVNVVDSWMASPSHKKAILTKVFRQAGIGAVRSSSGYGDCTDDVWFFTLDMGRRIVD